MPRTWGGGWTAFVERVKKRVKDTASSAPSAGGRGGRRRGAAIQRC